MRRSLDAALQFAAPALLIVVVGVVGSHTSLAVQSDFEATLVNVAIVIAIYVFVGNSGVLSFGHISFVAVGAFLAGIATVPQESKRFVMPGLYPFLQHLEVSNVVSLLLAAAAGGVFALIAGAALMRLNGLAAGIATFAVLGITNNLFSYWTRIGPGVTTLSLVPQTTAMKQATIGALVAAAVAFVYQRSRSGRLLRASREDAAAAQASGMHVYRHRLLAFTLSGVLAGYAGALLVHQLGSLTTGDVYLELTFLTLAMLVVGGASSLLGATLGALVVSGLDLWLGVAENGTHVGPWTVNLPSGTRLVTVGVAMAAVLLFRPSGITGGREFSLPRLASRRRTSPPVVSEP